MQLRFNSKLRSEATILFFIFATRAVATQNMTAYINSVIISSGLIITLNSVTLLNTATALSLLFCMTTFSIIGFILMGLFLEQTLSNNLNQAELTSIVFALYENFSLCSNS